MDLNIRMTDRFSVRGLQSSIKHVNKVRDKLEYWVLSNSGKE